MKRANTSRSVRRSANCYARDQHSPLYFCKYSRGFSSTITRSSLVLRLTISYDRRIALSDARVFTRNSSQNKPPAYITLAIAATTVHPCTHSARIARVHGESGCNAKPVGDLPSTHERQSLRREGQRYCASSASQCARIRAGPTGLACACSDISGAASASRRNEMDINSSRRNRCSVTTSPTR